MKHRRLVAAGAAALLPLTGTVLAVVAGAMTAAATSVAHHGRSQPHRPA